MLKVRFYDESYHWYFATRNLKSIKCAGQYMLRQFNKEKCKGKGEIFLCLSACCSGENEKPLAVHQTHRPYTSSLLGS